MLDVKISTLGKMLLSVNYISVSLTKLEERHRTKYNGYSFSILNKIVCHVKQTHCTTRYNSLFCTDNCSLPHPCLSSLHWSFSWESLPVSPTRFSAQRPPTLRRFSFSFSFFFKKTLKIIFLNLFLNFI